MALLFDLESVLNDFSDEMQKNIRFIYSLSLLPKTKVAFHASDADGIISAVILKGMGEFEHAAFIPLTYQEIKHPIFSGFLQALNWIAIVDLPPFNESGIKLYCDHHLTNKALTKTAEVVLFDENAPSAAFLLAKHFQDSLPRNLQLLADLTTITDTAGFTTPPPVEFLPNFTELTRQEQAWLLDDLCRTPESAEEVLSLVQDISTLDLKVFYKESYQQRILGVRKLRKKSIRLGKDFEQADVVLIIQGKEKVMTSALVHNLFAKGVKITCVMFPGKQFTGISLRVNSQVPENELEKYRVDYLASKLSGGGHPRAAGGRETSLKKALKLITDWVQEHHFTCNQYDLRKSKT